MRWKPRHIVLSIWWAISVAELASGWQTVDELFTHRCQPLCQNCTRVHAMPTVAERVIQIKKKLSPSSIVNVFYWIWWPARYQERWSNVLILIYISKPRQGVRLSQVQVQVQADRATRCIICVGKQAAFCHFAVFKFKVYLPLDLLNVSL